MNRYNNGHRATQLKTSLPQQIKAIKFGRTDCIAFDIANQFLLDNELTNTLNNRSHTHDWSFISHITYTHTRTQHSKVEPASITINHRIVLTFYIPSITCNSIVVVIHNARSLYAEKRTWWCPQPELMFLHCGSHLMSQRERR